MPILFSAVASDKSLLSKYASCDGNFGEILEEVLSKVPPRNEKMTYFHGHYLLHYVTEDAYFYFCITDKVCQRSRAFLFLNEIRRQFKARSKDGKALGDFRDVLSAEMYRYSEDYNTIVIQKGELDELNKIGVESSETILGEKILFVKNTDNLTYFSTISYVKNTPEQIVVTEAKSDVKLYITVVVICAMILGIAIYVFGPVSCVIVLGIFVLCLARNTVQT